MPNLVIVHPRTYDRYQWLLKIDNPWQNYYLYLTPWGPRIDKMKRKWRAWRLRRKYRGEI